MTWHLLGMKKRPPSKTLERPRIENNRITALWRQEARLSFSKHEHWTEAEVTGLPAGEHDYFERKSGALFDVAEKNSLLDVLAKAGSAFTNSGGGHLLLGVGDNGTFDGVPTVLSGRTLTRDWLEQVIPDLLDYRLNDFRVHTVARSDASAIPDGRELIVVDFGDSALAPHQSRRDTSYYYRAAGRSVRAPHFYLELLRQRLTSASLDFELMRADFETAWEYEGETFLRVVLKFAINNSGRVAAYKWRLVTRSFATPSDRSGDILFGPVPGSPGRNATMRVDDTILPGCAEYEIILFCVRLKPSSSSEERVRKDLSELFTGLRLNLQLATETSPGEIKETEVGPALAVDGAIPVLRDRAHIFRT